MPLSEDEFSDSSTNNSAELTSEETISANPQRQHPVFSGSIRHDQIDVVNHPHGSMSIFSAEPPFQVQANHRRGIMPIFSIGSASRTRVRRPRGSMPIFSIGASSQIGVNHPRGSMPIVSAGSASRIKSEVAQDSPSVGRPIVNGLYDPNFAIIGLPVDPLLRQFMFNPNFGNKHK